MEFGISKCDCQGKQWSKGFQKVVAQYTCKQ